MTLKTVPPADVCFQEHSKAQSYHLILVMGTVIAFKGVFYCTHFHRKVTEVYSHSAGMHDKHYSGPNLPS